MATRIADSLNIQRILEYKNGLVLRAFIVLAVLLFVLGVAFTSTRIGIERLVLLAGVVPGLAVLLVLLAVPPLGFILSVLGGIFVPFSGPSGINVTVFGVAFLVGIWILRMVLVDRKIALLPSRTMLPILLFIVSSIVSFIFGQMPWYVFAQQAPLDAQIGGLLIYLFAAGTFLATAHLITDLKWLRYFTWSFLFIGGIYVVARTLRFDVVDNFYNLGFISNSMFWTWLVSIAFAQFLLNKDLNIFWKIVLLGLMGATMYVAYFINGDWKSGYIPPLISVAVIVLIRFPKLTLALSPFAAIGFIVLAIQAIATDEYSWGTRLDAWIVVLEIAKISPILGMGFANYSFYSVLFPIRGYYIKFNSHSQFVDIIAQTGLVGLLIFGWILLEVGRLGLFLHNKIEDGFSKAYVYGVLGGLGGSLVAAFLVDWVLPYVYNIGFTGFRASVLPWIFFGGLVSVEQLFKQKKIS